MAWANGLIDLAMPYMIQTMRDYVGRVDILMQERKDSREDKKVSVPCLVPQSRAFSSDAVVVIVLTSADGAGFAACPGQQGMQAGTCLPMLLSRTCATCRDSMLQGS